MTTAVVLALLPEIVLVVAAVGIYLAGAFRAAPQMWKWPAAFALLLSAITLWRQHGAEIVSDAVTIDALTYYARWFALALGGLMVLIDARPEGRDGEPEYVGSLLLAVAGMMFVGGASDLVLLFVGLELISIPTYILLYLGRRDLGSREASIKYFFLSVLASAILLYGLSFLYGVAGSTGMAEIHAAVEGDAAVFDGQKLLRLALVFIVAGLGFRLTAVPLQFYAPDVYQGTSHANAALLSVAPKAAGFFVLLRILVEVAPSLAPLSWKIAFVVAILSMTLGNFVALWQDNIRRLMAYSSIAHTGYMLMALAAGLATLGSNPTWNGFTALLLYLAVYAVATVGVFAALSHLNSDGRQIDSVGELAGLGAMRPWTAAAMAICLFSLAGLPPLAGFWGKLLIFGSVLNVDASPAGSTGSWAWFVMLAIVGIVNAAVAAGYYLRIIATMYFRTPLATSRAQGGGGAWLAAVVAALVVIAIGVYSGPLIHAAGRVSTSIDQSAVEVPR